MPADLRCFWPRARGPLRRLVRDLGLDELRQQRQRFLPAEIAGLGGMTSGIPSCTMFSSVPHGHLLQRDRHLHLARQVRVVELVRVADALVRHQLDDISPPNEWLLPVVKFVNDIL